MKFVQHISGTGKLWPIIDTPEKDPSYWLSVGPDGRYDLPRSEYKLAKDPAPLSEWIDVTGDCEIAQAVMIFPPYVPALERAAMERASILYKNPHSLIKQDIFHPHQQPFFQVQRLPVNRIGVGVPNGCQKQTAFIVLQKRTASPL